MLRLLKQILPLPALTLLRSMYHPLLALISALANGFPARKMVVIGVNGTKGKSTTSEMVFAILTQAGYKTALASTIRFAINDESEPNLFKMTMPGRGYLQRFLNRAYQKGSTHAVIELTTEGAREWRHRFLSLDVLIMLNVQREHIESFGSFENYVVAKGQLVKEFLRSKKRKKTLVVCTEDEHNATFAKTPTKNVLSYSFSDIENLHSSETETTFTYKGINFVVPLPGTFNALNAMAAIQTAESLSISLEVARDALKNMAQVKGRLEPVECSQPFRVIVDYAHTPDSLRALYSAYPHSKKICVLGNTGGGRDVWKRPLMGAIADEFCEVVILTNEDPYDESPERIIEDMTADMKRAPITIMDRREAIREALTRAEPGDVVLISGKGTDPYIMEAKGKKVPWSDVWVVKEELESLGFGSRDQVV